MANVRPDRAEKSSKWNGLERGQLILIAGLTIAVILVALVLLLNTVIYTENLASRGIDAGGMDALEYRLAVIGGVGELLDEENRQSGNFSEKEIRVEDGIEGIDEALAANRIRQGVLAEVNHSSVDTREGIFVAQNESQQFLSDENSSSWTLATDVAAVRQFAVEVDGATTLDASNATDGFRLNVTDGSDTWSLFVYTDEDSGNLTVATTENVDPPVCSVNASAINASSVTLDVTGATLAGSPCDDLQWGEGVGQPYTIEIENGSEIEGTYELTVAGEPGDLDGAGESPFYQEAVYSATMEITYQTSDLHFVTNVRIAPGEPRD